MRRLPSPWLMSARGHDLIQVDWQTMKFLHAADLHIDSPLRGLSAYEGAPVAEMRGATRRAVENLVEAAISNKVDVVVVAGDVFDGDWKDYGTGLFWVAQLSRLDEAGIPVVFVAGNHDAASEVGRRLRLPANVSQLSAAKPETKRFDHLDFAVIGQSYATRSVTSDLAATYPPADPGLFTIGLLHTSLDGRPGHASYAPTTLDVLRSRGYQYWALGHVHQHEDICRDPWVTFSGNLQGRHARETGAKGATLVTVEGNEVTLVEPLPLDVVRWQECAVDASKCVDLEGVLSAVSTSLDAAVRSSGGRLVAARVRITGRSPAHVELWRNPEHLEAEIRSIGTRLGDVWVEKVMLDTRRVVRPDTDLIGAITARVDAAKNDPGALARYHGLFADLRNKLPLEIRGGEGMATEAAVPGTTEHVAATLDASVELILSLLAEDEL